MTCALCSDTAQVYGAFRGITIVEPCPRCRGAGRFASNGTLTITLEDGVSASVCVAAGDTFATAANLLATALQSKTKGTP